MKRRLCAVLLSLFIASGVAYAQTYQTAFQNARVLLNEKLYAQALQEAQRAIALDGSQWGGYYVAGTALVGLQRQGEAITFFQAALVRAPEQAKPIVNAAIVSCRQITSNENQAAPPATYTPPPSAASGVQTEEKQFAAVHNHAGWGPTCKGFLYMSAEGIRYGCTRGEIHLSKAEISQGHVVYYKKGGLIKIKSKTGTRYLILLTPESLSAASTWTLTGGDEEAAAEFAESLQALLGVSAEIHK